MMIWLGALFVLLFWVGSFCFGLGYAYKEISPFYNKSSTKFISNSKAESEDDGMFWGALFQQT